jgi:hypothetical protein
LATTKYQYSKESFKEGKSLEACGNCGAPSNIQDLNCGSCGNFLGFPNVKLANLSEELDALESRWEEARREASDQGLQAVFDAITEYEWQLTVTIPTNIALTLVTDPKNHYVNYEQLTGAGARAHAEFAHDAHRRMVAGALFASFGDKIVYGALSKGQRGLSTYGSICCQLKTKSVRARSSFLEMNSYEFVGKYKTSLPKGYRSVWENRGRLAALKLFDSGALAANQVPDDWDRMILQTDGKNRNLDEYIEGHIFGPFTVYSISDMGAADQSRRADKMVEAILEAFHLGKFDN